MNEKDNTSINNSSTPSGFPDSNMYLSDSHSSSSFFYSAPIELTTVEGYKQFIKKIEGNVKRNHVTVLKEDLSQGYILEDGNIIANIQGEAKNYLVNQACDE